MPGFLRYQNRRTDVATAANILLAREGVRGLTLRALHRLSGTHPSTLLSEYGSWDELAADAAGWTGEWVDDDARKRSFEGPQAFLPSEVESDAVDARAWCGWLDLARTHPLVGQTVARAREAQRRHLARELHLDGPALDLVVAALDGLRLASSLRTSPLSADRASEALDLLVRLIDGEDPQPAASSAAARSDATIASGSSAE